MLGQMKVRQFWEMKVSGYDEACVSGMSIPCLPRGGGSRTSGPFARSVSINAASTLRRRKMTFLIHQASRFKMGLQPILELLLF